MRWLPFVIIVALLVGCNSKPPSEPEPDLSVDPSIANAAAIVCPHIVAGEPILRARRDEPVDADDSGWQFLCDSGVEESTEGAQIWSVTQVIEHEGTLLSFINAPAGTIMSRADANSEWKPSE